MRSWYGSFFSKRRDLAKHSDIILAVGVVALVLLLVVPLPPFLLDTLLSFSIVMAVITLLLTIYVDNALEFSSFPSLLLFLTLFRLGLNIASTRMILSRGEGGDIIRTFGEFVTGGNTLIGLVLFVLLTMINFIVVTKGAGRVAEVAARFTLEALPGKQMAIDQELASGLVTHKEAKQAREEVRVEADFYGAMDGASKFVRGDAIAGIVITLVNIVGGLIIGMTVKRLPWTECWSRFSKLTIGDGLVSQIPALFISIGAGIIVTRVSSGSLGRILPKQMLTHPKVLYIAAAMLACLSLVPGMPSLVMLPMASALGFYGLMLSRNKKKPQVSEKQEEEAFSVYSLEVQLGYHLIEVVDELLCRVGELRSRLAHELGIIVPEVRIGDNLDLDPNTYAMRIKGVTVATGNKKSGKEIATHLREIIEQNAYQLLTRQDVSRMVESVRSVDAAVVEELIPSKLSLGQILKVLQNLLKEQISIRDFVSILEIIADSVMGGETFDADLFTEKVRAHLALGISEKVFGKHRVAYAITFDPKVEQIVHAALSSLRPQTATKIKKEVTSLVEKGDLEGRRVVVLTSAESRPHLRRLLEKEMPRLPVLSFAEMTPEVEVHSLGTVSNEVLL